MKDLTLTAREGLALTAIDVMTPTATRLQLRTPVHALAGSLCTILWNWQGSTNMWRNQRVACGGGAVPFIAQVLSFSNAACREIIERAGHPRACPALARHSATCHQTPSPLIPCAPLPSPVHPSHPLCTAPIPCAPFPSPVHLSLPCAPLPSLTPKPQRVSVVHVCCVLPPYPRAGAYYGLAVSFVLSRRQPAHGMEHPKRSATYFNDMFSMVGTLFLWIFWPSFNGACAQAPQLGSACTQAWRLRHSFNTGLVPQAQLQHRLGSACTQAWHLRPSFDGACKGGPPHLRAHSRAGALPPVAPSAGWGRRRGSACQLLAPQARGCCI